jgi:hypothetical protein
MHQIDFPSDDSGFPAALQKFKAMPLAEQLPLLVFALRQELARKAVFSAPIRAAAPALIPATPAASPGPAAPQVAPASPAVTHLKIIVSEFAYVRPTVQASSASRGTIIPAATPRSVSIFISLCVIFTLAIAPMIWQRNAVSGSSQEPELLPHEPQPASTASRVVPVHAAPPAAPPAPQSAQMNERAFHHSPGPLPVAVYFHRRGVHNDPTDRRKIDWLLEGRLTNLSDQALRVEVRVEASNALRASLIQIGVDPHGQRDFGVDDGLQMHPGDKITLASSAYSDLVVAGAH